jgi:hypothetical protein
VALSGFQQSLGMLGLPHISIVESRGIFERFDVRAFIAYSSALENTGHGRAIRARLAADNRVTALTGAMLNRGAGGSRFELDRVAMWWLWRANEVGEQRASQDLEAFLSEDEIEVLYVLWLYGLRTSDTILIADETRLVPIAEMPESGDKEAFLQGRSALGFLPAPVPEVALVTRRRTGKVAPADPPYQSEADASAQRTLHDIAALLNCVPGAACAPAYSTAYFPPEVPIGLFGGSGGGVTVHDVIPRREMSLSSDALGTFDEMLTRFRQLAPKQKGRMAHALHRLSQAKTRQSHSDQMLDLGISLEMLLLNAEHGGQDLPGQLSMHFRLRGSWLIAESAAERRGLFDVLGKIYSIRSQVAHNGMSKTLDNLEVSARESMLGQCFSVAERIFRALIL